MAGRSTWATFGGLRLKGSNRQEKNSICRIYTHKEGNRDAAALLYEGFLYGEAMDEELMIYYIEKFGAMRIPREHPYSISFSGKVTKRIREVYEYVWTDEEP